MLTDISINKLKESAYQGRLIPEGKKEKQKRLEHLIGSIRENGLMQPVTVRPAGEFYEIIDGHRRVEAVTFLGEKEIQAIVKDISDKEAQALSVVGNLQRENLSNIEKALAFKKILDSGLFKTKLELSKAIGMNETFVGDLVNTVNMDTRIIEDLVKNKTTNDVRLLRAIRRVEKVNEDQVSEKQWNIFCRFKEEGLSRSEVLQLVKYMKRPHKRFTVERSAHKIQIQFYEQYPKEQREKIKDLLEEKLAEIVNYVTGDER